MGKDGGLGPSGLHSAFSHTQLAVYVSSLFALCCIGYDSTHVGLAARAGRGAAKPWWRRRPPPATVAAARPTSLLLPHHLPPCLYTRCPQDIIQRSHINKKWYYLFGAGGHWPRQARPEPAVPPPAARCPSGSQPLLAPPLAPAGRGPHLHRPLRAGATCLFAYLYLRPLIRRGLGSASRGYINFSAVYICWLLMAVFYHLPSLESMGARAGD